ncbi:MAG: transcription antitermination factor NusB [Pseudomonadota bacterium]
MARPPVKSFSSDKSTGDRARPRKPDGASRPGGGARPTGRGDRPKGPRDQKEEEPSSVPPGFAARGAALDLLDLIRKGRSLDEALDSCRTFDALEGPDRGFSRALVSAVLRRRGSLDHVIGAFVDRPLPEKSYRIMDILRLVGAQTLFLGTPDHAAVSVAVAQAKALQETQGYAGLVNAVGRKMASRGAKILEDLPAGTRGRLDTPAWLWRSWEKVYGPPVTRKIVEAHTREAPLDLTVKTKADHSKIAEALSGSAIGPVTVRLSENPGVSSIDGYDRGDWWVQDLAASLPATLFGHLEGKTVFDLCAAPGGKTLQLAAQGANVVAVDQGGFRLKRLQENLARVAVTAETVKADVLSWEPGVQADAVLLDAPCTATGTIRRHPDIPWSKTADDLAGLSRIQADMIDKAISLLKDGGMLIYCVCSLQAEEGEHQIRAALARHGNVHRAPVMPDELPGLQIAINRDGDLRTLPFYMSEHGGMDGFFASRLVKS